MIIISYDSLSLLARVENLEVKLTHLKFSSHITLRLLPMLQSSSQPTFIITTDFPVQRFDFDVFMQRTFRIRTTALITAFRDVRIQAVAGCDAMCSGYRLLHNM
jgi:hypothetical protein